MATQDEALSVDCSNSSSSSSSTSIRFRCHGFDIYMTQEYKHGKLVRYNRFKPDPIEIQKPIDIDCDSDSDCDSALSFLSVEDSLW